MKFSKIAGTGDYREFAAILDRAMKEWKILSEECGLVDGKLISDTKELVFDPAHARFVIHTPYCGYFSGSPAESLRLSEKIEIQSENERITLDTSSSGKGKSWSRQRNL